MGWWRDLMEHSRPCSRGCALRSPETGIDTLMHYYLPTMKLHKKVSDLHHLKCYMVTPWMDHTRSFVNSGLRSKKIQKLGRRTSMSWICETNFRRLGICCISRSSCWCPCMTTAKLQCSELLVIEPSFKNNEMCCWNNKCCQLCIGLPVCVLAEPSHCTRRMFSCCTDCNDRINVGSLRPPKSTSLLENVSVELSAMKIHPGARPPKKCNQPTRTWKGKVMKA